METLQEKLVNIIENDLTKNVIRPLFEAMYNCRVAFTGGANEKGRDLIVYYKNQIDEPEFIGVQVKRKVVSSNSNTDSAQQLFSQLDQLKFEKVICPTTNDPIDVSKRIYITSYEIPEKVYDTHHGALEHIKKQKISIIDGKRLLELINKHAPELKDYISGENTQLTSHFYDSLTNRDLMKALDYKESKYKKICDIYCSSKLIFGNEDKNWKIPLNINSNNRNTIKVNDPEHAKLLSKINDKYNSYFKSNLVDTCILKGVESSLTNYHDLKLREKRLNSVVSDAGKQIQNKLRESQFSTYIPRGLNLEELEDFCRNGFVDVKPQMQGVDFIEFTKVILSIVELFEKRHLEVSNRDSIRCDLVDLEDVYNIEIDTSSICNTYQEQLNVINGLDWDDNSKNNVTKVLNEHKIFEFLVDLILKFKDMFEFKGQVPELEAKGKFTITDIFDSGLNTVVLGCAGSGKTTNLQVYAHNALEFSREQITLFMTLNQIAKHCEHEKDKSIEFGIWSNLKRISSRNLLTFPQFVDHLSKNSTCLILDSIDEAIASHSWLLEALKEFSICYRNCQIITSSRFTVERINELGFMNISLLPFDQPQKREFFMKWFEGDSFKVEQLMVHLEKHPSLSKVITNPLSATIMATLQDSNVPLPSTEAQLYRKRFELLSGMFDKFRGVNRLETPPEVILTVIRKLAYYIHDRTLQEFDQELVLEFLDNHLPDGYLSLSVFEELCTPCEILLKNPNQKFSFGHLRFQEFLASEQLVHVRSGAKWDRMLLSSWWHDVFILYAQHSEDIDWILDYVISDYDLTLSCQSLLRAMIDCRPTKEKTTLTTKIEIAIGTAKDEQRLQKADELYWEDDWSLDY